MIIRVMHTPSTVLQVLLFITTEIQNYTYLTYYYATATMQRLNDSREKEILLKINITFNAFLLYLLK